MPRVLLDHDLVQAPLRWEVGARDRLDGECEPLLHPGPPVQHGSDQRQGVGWLDLGEEPHAPHLDPEHRTADMRGSVRRPQERPVASDAHHEVERLADLRRVAFVGEQHRRRPHARSPRVERPSRHDRGLPFRVHHDPDPAHAATFRPRRRRPRRRSWPPASRVGRRAGTPRCRRGPAPARPSPPAARIRCGRRFRPPPTAPAPTRRGRGRRRRSPRRPVRPRTAA